MNRASEQMGIPPAFKRLPWALTGGIGRFRGASGDIEAVNLGTNVTGCPNFQAKFKFRSGSGRDWSH
jgi:hypothetical protein